MFYAKNVKNEKIDINKANKEDKYFCTCCNAEVIPKQGKVNQWHFSHKNLKECDEWHEMTKWHREWQNKFPVQYREVILTKNNKKHIADIKVDNLVIEFQHSPISATVFEERNNFYTKDNYLVWLFDVRNKDIVGIKRADTYKISYYKWNWAYKFLDDHIKELKNITLFLQIEDNIIIEVKWNAQRLKYFNGIRYNKYAFMNRLRKIYMDINKSSLQRKAS